MYRITVEKPMKGKIIDAFVNPDNPDEIIVTVEFYLGLKERITTDENGNTQTVYEGYAERVTEKFPIDSSIDDIKNKFLQYWNDKYSKISSVINMLNKIKNEEIV